jgi:hypothetical protein
MKIKTRRSKKINVIPEGYEHVQNAQDTIEEKAHFLTPYRRIFFQFEAHKTV